MNKRTITLHILIGLPGSGKTCFAQNTKARRPNDIMILGENELQDTEWRIYKRDTGKRFPPMNSNELQRNINAYSGAAFKTLIMDGLFLTTERVLEVIQMVSSKFTLKEIVLDYWPENKDECLRNDYLRRRRGSSLSIESLSIQTDFNVIRAAYPNTIITTHSVYHTPDWVIFFRPYLTLTDERELRSEEWTTGGEYWSYDGNRSPISPEEAPTSFQELDDLLEKICPNISLLQYKKITSDCVSVKEREDSDYYSCTVKQYFACDLETLYKNLCQFGYIHPDSESPQDTQLTAAETEAICAISGKDISSMSPLESAEWKLYTKSFMHQETNPAAEVPDFEYDNVEEDPEIAEKGEILMWVDGRNPAIQNFVKALSQRIGSKCDWAYRGGRAHIDVLPEAIPKARAAVLDKDWIEQFIVAYTDKTFEEGTFFSIMKIL